MRSDNPPVIITEAVRFFFAALCAREKGHHWTAKYHCDRLAEIAARMPGLEDRLHTYVAQARAATKDLAQPGQLRMLSVHPLSDRVAVRCRFALDDQELVEHMTRAAISASNHGHNVYVEARTVRPELTGKQRGSLADSTAVFALVIDSDADKNASWTPTAPVSLAVETSPANAHY